MLSVRNNNVKYITVRKLRQRNLLEYFRHVSFLLECSEHRKANFASYCLLIYCSWRTDFVLSLYLKTVKLLLNLKPNITIRDAYGLLPIQYAILKCIQGNGYRNEAAETIVTLLLEYEGITDQLLQAVSIDPSFPCVGKATRTSEGYLWPNSWICSRSKYLSTSR